MGGGGPPSSSSSSSTGGSSTNSTSSMGGGGGGGGGGSGGSGGNSSSLCGPRSRPSRIPQPSSRLPQPVHHHHPPGPEGPDRSAGMWSPSQPSLPSYPYSDSPTNGELLASEVFTLKRLDISPGSNYNNSNRLADNTDGALKQTFGVYEETQTHQKTAVPQMPVAPLSFSLRSPRVGTVSPLISPQTLGGGKEPFIPSSPAHKGNPFWAVVPPMPPSPAGRPGSFSFPSDNSSGGDSLGRGMPPFLRNSSHSKETDRMSTCSSTSEQSVTSTQSNGVRRQDKVTTLKEPPRSSLVTNHFLTY